jgi:hypothetical protein
MMANTQLLLNLEPLISQKPTKELTCTHFGTCPLLDRSLVIEQYSYCMISGIANSSQGNRTHHLLFPEGVSTATGLLLKEESEDVKRRSMTRSDHVSRVRPSDSSSGNQLLKVSMTGLAEIFPAAVPSIGSNGL